jgi:hypothetical protein
MSTIKYWIGTKGPFFFDSSKAYADDDTLNFLAFRSEGPIRVEEAPTHDYHTVRLVDLENIITSVEVFSIDAPVELNAIGRSQNGSIIVAYQAAAPDRYTIYAWDDAETTLQNSPFYVDGVGGKWVAIGGRYQNGFINLNGALYFLDSDVSVFRDGSDLKFNDPTAGTKTLSELATSGADELSDLSDVADSTPTDRNALMADGSEWTSRALVELDISDLDKYTQVEVDNLLAGKAASGHTHDDRYYTETELDGGQLDTRYYTEAEIDAMVAEELTDLDDVNTSTPTNRNVLVADGVDWESRALVELDISDLDKYTQTEVDNLLAAKSDTGHDHDDRYYTETELDGGQLDDRYYQESEVDSLLSGKSDTGHVHAYLGVDGANNRKIRHSYLTIEDGTNADTIKCTVSSFWNGGNVAVTDNIGKGDTVDGFTLDSDGKELTISNLYLGQAVVSVMPNQSENNSGTPVFIKPGVSSSNIVLTFQRHDASDANLTLMADVGSIRIDLLYIAES